MIKFGAVLHTNGKGHWSGVAKAVKCTHIEVTSNAEMDFGELRVYFDTASWDTSKDGLIYTDNLFLKELKVALANATLDPCGVGYSEQGMQGVDYVSLDVGGDFIKSVKDIAPELF